MATVAEIHRSKEGPEKEYDSSGQRLGVVLMIVELPLSRVKGHLC